jgi:hypothetical protein
MYWLFVFTQECGKAWFALSVLDFTGSKPLHRTALPGLLLAHCQQPLAVGAPH